LTLITMEGSNINTFCGPPGTADFLAQPYN
jgi:hypothetical protein